ncbi:MAG: hypothetical protein Q7K57_57155 [Burkholderiaceae bacterium]|nr:hypothetical protein [Burkholderiaceae bacterium]
MKYTTIAVLSLQAGVLLGLTESQAATRKTVLTAVPARKGWYITTGPVQFKRGEEFLHDGELPKHLAEAVDPGEGRPSKQASKASRREFVDAALLAAKAKAEAEAKALDQAAVDAKAIADAEAADAEAKAEAAAVNAAINAAGIAASTTPADKQA